MAKKGAAKKKLKKCYRKSGENKGRLKPGWKIVNGQCRKAAKKKTKTKKRKAKKRSWATKKYSVKRLAGVVRFKNKKTGKWVQFKTKGKGNLRGLSGRASATKDARRAANAKAAHRSRVCINSRTGKLLPGWKQAKGGNCVQAKGGKAKARTSSSRGRTTSTQAKNRNWLAKPCVNSKTGKVKPGFRIAKGTNRCIKSAAKTKKRTNGRKTTRAAGPATSYKGMPKAKFPCLRKSGSKKGKLKPGWMIRKDRSGRSFCTQSKGGAKKSMIPIKFPCMTAKGKIKRGWSIRKKPGTKQTACFKKGSKTPVKNLRGLRRR